MLRAANNTPRAKEITGSKNGYHTFLALTRRVAFLYVPLMDVEYEIGRIVLDKDDISLPIG